MLVTNSIESFYNTKNNKKDLFSDYSKTAMNFRLKPVKISLNKSKKSKTIFLDNQINLPNNNTMNSKHAISNNNSIYNKEFIVTALKNDKSKTSSGFYHNKRKNLKIKSDNIINNNNIINIINYSKISSIYNSYNNSKISNTYTPKPKIKIKIIKKINEFNSLEKYILKAERTIKEMKHEYKPNLKEFYINKELKNYINKSKNIIHAKKDINSIYRDSHMLNNICDYVSNALFKMKIQKRNNIKKINIELNKKKSEILHKKILELKIKNKELPFEKLFKNKNFTTENLDINPKMKAQMIYKSCYPYNSIKALFDRFSHKKQLKTMLKNNTNII